MENRLNLIKDTIAQMESDYQKWTLKGNKSAGKRLRLACSALSKEFKAWRKELLEEAKDNE